MGIRREARQVALGVIRVDAVDLKSITDCSAIIGLYKVELFIQRSEKCQDSCYQSRQVKSQHLGQMCGANRRQMLNIHGVVGLKYDIHHDLCSWATAAVINWGFLAAASLQQINCKSLRRGDVCLSRSALFLQQRAMSWSWRLALLWSVIRHPASAGLDIPVSPN